MTTLDIEAPDIDQFEDDDETPVGRSSYRDDFQLARDADVKVLFEAWKTAGKPSHEVLTAQPGGKASPEFKAAAKKVYIVKAKERVEVKKTIRRACLLYKAADDGSGLGGVPLYVRDKKLEDGRWRLKFTWSPQPVKAESNGDGNAEQSKQPEQPTTQHDESGEQATPTTGSQQPQSGDERSRGRFGGRR